MFNVIRSIVPLLIFIGCSFISSHAQDIKQGEWIVLTMTDSSEYIGKVLSQSSDSIHIESAILGPLHLSKSSVLKVDPHNVMVQMKSPYAFENVAAHRNFFTESGMGLKAGEWHYWNLMLVGQIVTMGVTDNFNLAMGTEFVSVLNRESPIILLSPKVMFSGPDKKVHFGFGSNLVFNSNAVGNDFGGTLYTVVTIGNRNSNFTAGVGVGYSREVVLETPVFQLGGNLRLSEKFGLTIDYLYFGTENLTSLNTLGTLTLGLLSKNVNMDVGVITNVANGVFPALSFTIKLNRD